MATYVIGDIHGRLPPLADLLCQIEKEAVRSDSVVFVGDYIDRGRETKGCIEAILAFRRGTRAEVICLCGNHEDWLLRTLHDYRRHSWLLGMEAFDTILSYSPPAARALRDAVAAAGAEVITGEPILPYDLFFDELPATHLDFLQQLAVYHRTPDCVCTHGGLDPARSRVEDQSREACLWGTDGFPGQYRGPEIVVYGHHDNGHIDDTGWPMPRLIGRTIGLDTISHGVLTAVRLPDGRVFQSARHAAGWPR
ncbi:MAG: metallophosphoesterase [Bacteroidales bacterium]